MARSLIRLPQLNASSIPDSGSIEFANESGTAILTLDSQNTKVVAKQKLEMSNNEIDFDNGSGTSVANISATGSIRIGASGSEKFTLDASSGESSFSGAMRLKANLDVGVNAGDFKYDTTATKFSMSHAGSEMFSVNKSSGNMEAAGTAKISGLANLDGGIEVYDAGNTKNVFTVSTAGAMVVDSTAQVVGLANLDGGIEVYDSGNSKNVFTVDTAGAMVVDSTATVKGLANLDGGIEVYDGADNVFTVSTTGAITSDSTAQIKGLANLDGGIEIDNAGTNTFTVSTIGTIYGDDDIWIKGNLAFGGSGSEYLKSDSVNGKLISKYHVTLKDASGNEVIKLDKDDGSAYFKGDVSIDGNLIVEGTRTFLNTQEASLEDTTIALGMPGGMMEVTYTVTAVDQITVTYDAAQVVKGSALASGDEIYLVSSDLANGFKEGVYTIPAPGGSGANSTLVISVASGTYGSTNATAVKAFMSKDIFVQSAPYDGTGLLLPAAERTVGLLWSNSETALELTEAHLRVVNNDIKIEKTNGGQKLSFTDGADSISLVAANPSGTRSITVPDASGLMAVSVATSGGQAQGAENFGLQLASSGQLSIDINAIGGSLAGSGLASSDEIMISDASASNEIKKTTLGDIQTFLSSGGTQKQYISASQDANGYVSYSALSAGFKSSLEAASEGSREIYLNGVLMREGSGNDVEVDAGNARLDFTFAVEAGDIVAIVVRA